MLAGLAPLLDRSGLVFLPILLLWWVGLWLRRRTAGGMPRMGWREVALWGGGVLVVFAPAAGAWLGAPELFATYWQGPVAGAALVDWWANLRQTAFTFMWTPDASSIFGYTGHFVGSVVAPLFVLGLGALLLNLDRLVGWCLLTWVGITVLYSSVANLAVPDWPTLLPLLPAVGLTTSFAIDRLLHAWAEITGAPSAHGVPDSPRNVAAVVLATALIAAVAGLTWIGYYPFASTTGDAASYTGRALRALEPGAMAVLAASAPETSVGLDDPVLLYVAGARVGQALALAANALPATLPTGSLVIVQPQDAAAQGAVQAMYPQGQLAVTRDLHGNPRLLVYRVP
jgi:hypothetical protein